MKVFIESYADDEARAVAARLRNLYELSDHTHRLVDDPENADLIFVAGLGNDMEQHHYIQSAVNNEVIGSHPNRCFTISYRDKPIIFNRGIYESARRSGARGLLTYGRVRGGTYGLSGSFNAFVKAHNEAGLPQEKIYLFSFVGRLSSSVRQQLVSMPFERNDIYIEDSSDFSLWNCPDKDELERRQRKYYDALVGSKFSLCPRGYGTGSVRLFESMRCGVAPIIISDGWIPPGGLRWKDFSLNIAERKLDRLEDIADANESRCMEMGYLARQAYEKFFREEAYFNYLVKQCSEMKRGQVIPESFYWALRMPIASWLTARTGSARSSNG